MRAVLSTTTLATLACEGFFATFGTWILVPAASNDTFGLSLVSSAGSTWNFSASSSCGLVKFSVFSSAFFSNVLGTVLLKGPFTSAG